MRALLAATAVALVAAPAAHGAELFYGVTESNRLVSFASDSPGSIRSSVAISGMLESENIVGIDIRPANGRLYGLGSANLLYEIDTGTGRARPVGPLFPITIRGTSLGFDFDPVTDEARIVSNAETNMRVDPDDGLLVDHDPSSPTLQPDVDLTYALGDSAEGRGENVGALASTPGTESVTVGIDTGLDTLVRLDPANDGQLHTVAPLGTDAGDPNGFDVASDGVAYAVFTRGKRRVQDLMKVDLSSGRATRATRLSAIGTYLRNRPDPLRALAAVGRVAADKTRPGLVFTPGRTPRVRGLLRGKPLVLLVSCTEACRVVARLLSGRSPVARAIRFVRERQGVVKVRLRLSRKGRRVVRRNRSRQLRLQVRARDAAGNVTQTR